MVVRKFLNSVQHVSSHSIPKAVIDAIARKTVKCLNKNSMLKPIKIYCYKSLIEYLSAMLNRPRMIDICNRWRDHSVAHDIYMDIYDGKIMEEILRPVDSYSFQLIL